MKKLFLVIASLATLTFLVKGSVTLHSNSAFRITAASGNTTAISGAFIIDIDYPLLNGDSNALVLVTPNGMQNGTNITYVISTPTVAWSSANGHWKIVQPNTDGSPVSAFLGQVYTLFVLNQ